MKATDHSSGLSPKSAVTDQLLRLVAPLSARLESRSKHWLALRRLELRSRQIPCIDNPPGVHLHVANPPHQSSNERHRSPRTNSPGRQSETESARQCCAGQAP